MKRNHLARALALIAFALVSIAARAQGADATPDALIKRVVTEVMDAVKADPQIQAGNIPKVNALVDTKILPYVDFKQMTASAVGRNWSAATPAQQEAITEQFRKLLTFTYSGALSQARDQTIQFKPFRGDPADSVAQVNTEVISSHGGEPVQLNYKLRKEPEGWKIIDVNILGVWLVQNYRSSFADQVSSGGIDGLIKTLTDKNNARSTS